MTFNSQIQEKISFIRLGVMGQPMALNLSKAGIELIVWNRSPEPTEPLCSAGATVASTVDEVFAQTQIVIVMLVNDTVMDTVIGRGTRNFAKLVENHILISMGSNPPEYSRSLAADILAAGGRYVEAPVSGSRKPAENGQLVCLLGGDPETITEIRPLFTPMCRETVYCGQVGNAALMKLAAICIS
jgi:3-hydroxyisobutyrate dehydrogenase